MTRQHTRHVPNAGIRLAWPQATTVVLDPGPDERARSGKLSRERFLVAVGVVLSGVGVVLLVRSEPFDHSWLFAAGLLLSALACQALRPRRRTVPAGLVDLLEPLRAAEPAEPGVIQRLVWEAADLTRHRKRIRRRAPSARVVSRRSGPGCAR